MNEDRTSPDEPSELVTGSTTSRRRALLVLGGGGLGLVAAACSSGKSLTDSTSTTATSESSTSTTAGTTATSAATATDATCSVIPEETAGPFPGDGSNGVNVLTEDGVVRSDIRTSFGSGRGLADGVPLTVEMTVVDTANGCQPLAGAAVYLWHCDMEGNYSLYSQGVEDENYLRGVQETDGDGKVSFTTIFPGAYSGRWPHAHFEVYPSVAGTSSASNKLVTSQMAFPEDVCDTVYAADGYSQSVQNLSRTSLTSDMVFRDGVSLQTPVMSGSVDDGFVAKLTVPV